MAAASFGAVHDTVPVQAPAPASVVLSVSVRGVNAGGLGFLHAGVTGRVFGNVACRGPVMMMLVWSPRALLLVERQVAPWLHWVEVFGIY